MHTKSHIFHNLFASTKKNVYLCRMDFKDNNIIIATLYQKGVLRDECSKFVSDKYLLDDIVNDVALILMAKPKELILRLFAKGEIVFYIRRILKNQVCSKTSPFYKSYLSFQNKTVNYGQDI